MAVPAFYGMPTFYGVPELGVIIDRRVAPRSARPHSLPHTTLTMTDNASEDRRKGPPDRRRNRVDRRHAERLPGDLTPRRDPDVRDRRRKPDSTAGA